MVEDNEPNKQEEHPHIEFTKGVIKTLHLQGYCMETDQMMKRYENLNLPRDMVEAIID